MKLQFVGANHQVTGSAHYVEACGKRFLVDYGMEQGNMSYESQGLPCAESEIDFVLLTHAHVDHSGMLPYLCAKGFSGPIYTTDATADLCSIMLRDCAHIQLQEAEWKARKKKRGADITEGFEPLYTMADADNAIRLLVSCHYDVMVDICEGIRVRFTDVGHLLGSASIEVFLSENGVYKTICFSGDIGNKDQPLIKDPAYTKRADYVLMESTYGDRYHEKSEINPIEDLAKIIQETLDGGGNVVIPSFAVGRTQEILYFIKQIKERELVKYHDFPVYVDSPLAVDATEIFQKNFYTCFDEEALEMVRKGENPLTFPGLNLAITAEESKAINSDEEPKVIISASGMCEAGRV
ncbi:MAG: MBL fold metallo-hydrolase, partial [Lachnospiraceae bacterium]|nr:MBL fold metallo-hydrolase [Lachnospiraceae bacterium]